MKLCGGLIVIILVVLTGCATTVDELLVDESLRLTEKSDPDLKYPDLQGMRRVYEVSKISDACCVGVHGTAELPGGRVLKFSVRDTTWAGIRGVDPDKVDIYKDYEPWTVNLLSDTVKIFKQEFGPIKIGGKQAGVLTCRIVKADIRSPSRLGWALLSIGTLMVANGLGAPTQSYISEIEIEVRAENVDGGLMFCAVGKGRGSAYRTFYRRMNSASDAARLAHAKAVSIALADAVTQIP